MANGDTDLLRPDAVIEFGARGIGGVPAYYVRDNGTGFDKKDADRLFAPLQLKASELLSKNRRAYPQATWR